MFIQGTVQQFLDTCQIGDCLHWWGTSGLSRAIELFSKGPSHVAQVRRIEARTPAGVILVESTQIETPKRFIGVVERPFADELADYTYEKGYGVHCPIRGDIRARTDWAKWGAFMDSQVGHPYAYGLMCEEAYNAFVINHNLPILATFAERFTMVPHPMREFCSMVVAYGFEPPSASIFSAARIPSLTAPLQTLQAAIYGSGVQILGTPLTSDFGYNTIAP